MARRPRPGSALRTRYATSIFMAIGSVQSGRERRVYSPPQPIRVSAAAHSYRSASMGSRRDALRAGYRPKTTPTPALTASAAQHDLGARHHRPAELRRQQVSASRHRTTTPSAPPMAASTRASMRNCAMMSAGCAPTAMRMPISRVRSVTDTSMMFMTPMPPTISDTSAIDEQQRRHGLLGRREHAGHFGHAAGGEIVFIVGPEPMPLAQQRADFLARARNGLRRHRAHEDASRHELAETALHARLEGRQRNEDHVVLVRAHRVLTLASRAPR